MWIVHSRTMIGGMVWSKTKLFRRRWVAVAYKIVRDTFYTMPHAFPTWCTVGGGDGSRAVVSSRVRMQRKGTASDP